MGDSHGNCGYISHWDNVLDDLTIKRIQRLDRSAEALRFRRGTVLYLEPITESILGAVVMLENELEFAVPMGYHRIYDSQKTRFWWIHHPHGWLSSGILETRMTNYASGVTHNILNNPVVDFLEFSVIRHFNPAIERRLKLQKIKDAQPKPIKPPRHLAEVFKLVKPVMVVDAHGTVGWHIPFWRDEHPLTHLIPDLME